MKRKVVNHDIQQKKLKQVIEKEQERDLKHELDDERITYPKKVPKKRPKRGHK